MDQKQLQAAVQALMDTLSEQLPGVMTTGTPTVGFVLDMAIRAARGDYNVFPILDELAILEGRRPGPSQTKPASAFRKPPLQGLWHKHHFQARFIPHNLLVELSQSDVVGRVLRPRMGETITEDVINELAYAAVVENLERRGEDRRLTGEWIIFRKEGDRHQYLTLASHREGDEEIAKRIVQYDALEKSVREGTNTAGRRLQIDFLFRSSTGEDGSA